MSEFSLTSDEFHLQDRVYREFYVFPYNIEPVSTVLQIRDSECFSAITEESGPDSWRLLFLYKSHEFAVESHFHGTATFYAVLDPTCPDELLQEVLAKFELPMRYAVDMSFWPFAFEQPPEPVRPRRVALRWLIRICATAVGVAAFLDLGGIDDEAPVGLVACAVFWWIASFSSDFR